ncbi:MAG TPA: hypothetical protein VKQ73_17590 [Stellaceae bacterium]|nr:hypothetical protein [Stellaceae bacterium]
MRLWARALAVLVAAAGPAVAGTVITSSMTMPQAAGGKSVVYLEPDRVRIESQNSVTIFRADQNTVYVLKPSEKTFIRVTPETMKQVAAAMSAARAQLAQQMKSMTPAERAKIEKMLPGAGAGAAQAPQFEFRKAGGTATFGKWSCERVEQLADGRPQAQLCVARLSDLGLGPDDLAALRRFEAFMRQAMPGTAAAGAAIDPQALRTVVGYEAYPVHSEIPGAGVQTTTETVEKKAIPADLFELPAGYREQAMPAAPAR